MTKCRPPKTKTEKRRRKAESMQRSRNEEIGPERVRQFERLLGRKWLRADTAHETTLGILCDRGYITIQERDKGLEYARLYADIFPQVNPKTGEIGGMAGRGSVASLPEDAERRDIARTLQYKRATDAMGPYVAIVVKYATTDDRPAWLNERIAKEDRYRRKVSIEAANQVMGLDSKKDAAEIRAIIRKERRTLETIRDHVKTYGANVDLLHLRAGLQALIDGGKR